uniref:HNH nuclease domain-containing protein n=1 Tax=viral metagenome TaxID=1070528 RepID=A0A6C0JQN0_9ZZZZ
MKNNTWLYAIIISIECNNEISSIDFTKFPFTHKRQKITISDRNKLWQLYNNKQLEGKCYICYETISYNTFECGHIVPVCKGGNNSLSNMKCICGPCNKDCGIMNLEEYKLLLVN